MNAEMVQPGVSRRRSFSRWCAAYICQRESLRRFVRGQTMTEYALILAAVAVLVFLAYQTTGQTITNLVQWGAIHNDLVGS